jgi:hypothetical protein
VASALAVTPGQSPAPPADEPSYAAIVSVERVRAALDRPPSRLLLPERKPDFAIDIREREQVNRFMTPILAFIVAPGVPQTAPSPTFGSHLLPLLTDARKAYAKHAARQEVRRDIAAYCAAQPDRGAGIEICQR